MYQNIGRENWQRGYQTERLVSSFLPGSLLCAGIDIIYEGKKIEVKSSTKRFSGGGFVFVALNREADIFVFVGITKKNRCFYWTIPKHCLRSLKTITLNPTEKSGRRYYRQFRCSPLEIKSMVHKYFRPPRKRRELPSFLKI